jgi:YD repeat-containing protein
MRRILASAILLLTMGAASTLRAQSSPVQYFYDDLGRLVKVVDQNGNFATYSYDAVGNLLAITRSALPGSGQPAVLNFTPQQGPVGATVTIQGQGFSTTPGANTVQFNGTLAAVSAATAFALRRAGMGKDTAANGVRYVKATAPPCGPKPSGDGSRSDSESHFACFAAAL